MHKIIILQVKKTYSLTIDVKNFMFRKFLQRSFFTRLLSASASQLIATLLFTFDGLRRKYKLIQLQLLNLTIFYIYLSQHISFDNF